MLSKPVRKHKHLKSIESKTFGHTALWAPYSGPDTTPQPAAWAQAVSCVLCWVLPQQAHAYSNSGQGLRAPVTAQKLSCWQSASTGHHQNSFWAGCALTPNPWLEGAGWLAPGSPHKPTMITNTVQNKKPTDPGCHRGHPAEEGVRAIQLKLCAWEGRVSGCEQAYPGGPLSSHQAQVWEAEPLVITYRNGCGWVALWQEYTRDACVQPGTLLP